MRYKDCTQNIACSDFSDTFLVIEPKFKSIVYEYELYCDRQWLKSVVINVSYFTSAFLILPTSFLSDSIGNKMIFIYISPFGILGVAIGLISSNLPMITIGFTLLQFYTVSTLIGMFVYLNEMIIDPLRSKASGVKTFALALGAIGKYHIKFGGKYFFSYL